MATSESDDVQWPNKARGRGPAFINLGNLCYVNSSVQPQQNVVLCIVAPGGVCKRQLTHDCAVVLKGAINFRQHISQRKVGESETLPDCSGLLFS